MPGKRLDEEERQLIAQFLWDGLGYSEIGRRLQRPASTIQREVTRNGGHNSYRPGAAHRAASERAMRRMPAVDDLDVDEEAYSFDRSPGEVQEFHLRLVGVFRQTGLSLTAARILAEIFMTDKGSLSATELVLRLSVSPATVSRSTTYLQEIDLLHSERDGKRVRYYLGEDLWYRAWLSSAQRNSVWAHTGLEGAEIFGLGTPVGARLKDMGQFFAFVVVDMESTRQKWLDFFEKKKRARGEVTEDA
ncbi:Helix-turn-helix domain-containing protein [Lentzea waywayandensis]|uniref:Helix-turn-helix domain-containing protein n=1 Tax=Lentzea waywayandensis TaxID=84724 RepID=A0A1I6F172_9PSEU|nr:helix-turn-helix domain-containing protein [Lentzea waywayandensis]SFR23698.1 Helix-turn-helix domain-containing protein [Lentzea waywayandensis]